MWSGPNFNRGQNRKIAIIDTGIDYTHGNYRAPGTVATIAEYNAANAADTLPANPALFGPGAPKVKGGFDFVGDAYNASGSGAQLIPQPDPNPLDCNGHGSHVSGTAAGFGVLSNGSTFGGPYDTTSYSPVGKFRIGPGVAPRANLYAVRVFGCAGSTNETVDAIEWSVDNGMDVINMSLGSSFGTADDPSAVAADNAAQSGIVVVTSAGNSGPSPYITGSPGTGTHVVSTAANESLAGFPGFTLTLPTAPSPITAINANGEPDVAERDAVHDRLGQRQSRDDDRRRVARLQRVGLSDTAERDVDGGHDPRSLRTRRQGHSEPAGRLRGGGDGEQLDRAASVRRADLLAPGHGRAVHGHHPVHRRSRAWPRRRPRTVPGSVPRRAR